ncbi:hypothetical protein LQE92_03975 [Lacrimispora sp. NSJ-141]|uniref:Uncharacterized protein n=1 Tax=Lientehia hominis TaxID=2897778 RepID=A0AAP2RH48_9FIRM|nr:hypothetical protein [Lientehia hominis]MCD2491781.1 hypothetical protein [Lientehia hominis]
MKRIISILLMCVLAISSFSLVAFADEDDGECVYFDESGVIEEDPIRYDLIGPSPRWIYVNDTTLSLGYDGSNAVCYVYISGLSNCTKISGTLILYQKSGSSYISKGKWSNMSTTSDYLSRSRQIAVPRGYTYKLVFDGTAYGTTGSEPIYLSTESTF